MLIKTISDPIPSSAINQTQKPPTGQKVISLTLN